MTSPYSRFESLRWFMRFFDPSTKNSTDLRPEPRRALLSPAADTVTLCFFGDLMCSPGDRVPRVAPAISEIFARADLVIGNCESPVVFGELRPHARYLFHFAMAEEYLAKFLDALGARRDRCALTIANNHIADQGQEGLDDSVKRLRGLGITPIGHCSEGQGPITVVERGGLKIGLAAWSNWLNSERRFANQPGIWRTEKISAHNWQDDRRVLQLDLLLGSPHWDYEFEHFPRTSTRALAKDLTGRGFDLIVGHHPHVLQPIERFSADKLCLYSLGNVNGPWFRSIGWPVRLGAIFEVSVARDGPNRSQLVEYRIHPFAQLHQKDGSLLIAPLEEAPDFVQALFQPRLDLVLPPPRDYPS